MKKVFLLLFTLMVFMTSINLVSAADTSCWSYNNQSACIGSPKFSCLWDSEYNYCNTDSLKYVSCGNAYDIPYQAPQIVSFSVTFLKVSVPIILVLVSIITLLKAVGASKEDEIKKAQSSLVKKIIASVMAFFVITIVQFVILKVADGSDQNGVSKCLSCFLNNDCLDNLYYKSNLSGIYYCKYINGKVFPCIELETNHVSQTNTTANTDQDENQSNASSEIHTSSSGKTHGGGGGRF